MLGLGNQRINQLEAENRILRAELLAQIQRIAALSRIIISLQEQNESMARHCYNMDAVARNATQQAQAGRGVILNETVLDRICPN